MGRCPALEDAIEVRGEGAERLSDGIEQRGGIEAETDMVDESGDAPSGGLRCRGVADPAQHFLGAVGRGGGEAAGLELGQGVTLVVGESAIAGLEHGPAGGLGEVALTGLGLAHLVDGGCEQLDDMEPVDGEGGVWEVLGRRRQERRRHVAHDLADHGRFAAMGQHEGPELGHAGLALAGRDEDDRLVAAVHVDEHGDVVVAAPGRRLVETERAHAAQIEPGDGPADIVIDDPPQPLVGDADEARRRQHRHLAHQDQRGVLEQQREPAARPRPRDRRPLDPAIRASDPRHPCGDEAAMLEEVQVLPGKALEVVRLAGAPALRAGKHRAPVRNHLQVQLMRPLLDIQPLAGKLPRRAQAKPEREYLPRFHRSAPHAASRPA